MVICPKCEFANTDDAATCARCSSVRYVVESPSVALVGATADGPTSDRTPMPPQPDLTLSFRHGSRTLYGETKSTPSPSTMADQPLPQLPSALTVQNRRTGLSFRDEPDSSSSADSATSNTTGSSPPPAPQLRVRLVVLRGMKIGAEYPVYEGRNTIGRFVDKPVDIDLLAQESVEQTWCSRVHAAISFDKSVVLIEDLNSLNGTWINGTRIHPGQPRVLKANDVIQVGTVQMRVIVE